MSTHETSSRIGVTLGDPSGIGPEIVAKAVLALSPEKRARIHLFGDRDLLHPHCEPSQWACLKELSVGYAGELHIEDVTPGQPNRESGRAQVDYLEAAVRAARAGEIAALATAPICKQAAQEAGFAFPGHTEFLAERLQAERVAMMFAGPRLKVVLATVHEALAEVPRVLSSERIAGAIELMARALRDDFGIARPRIGVLGLNPHAGEGGRFGDEEQRIISPAIRQARACLGEDVAISEPLVPDAAFRMPFDGFVAMYHDQGLIAVKLLDFDEAVNLTLGLPIVRTSPDHGVAYDIAGRGVARATSMSAAIELALHLVDQRKSRATAS